MIRWMSFIMALGVGASVGLMTLNYDPTQQPLALGLALGTFSVLFAWWWKYK